MSNQEFAIEYANGKVFKVGVRDLLGSPTDTIVNPANSGLSHGSGLAAVIANETGPKLEQHCDKIIKQHGQIPVTKAVATTAGNLPFKGVIHAVGPRNGDSDEQQKIEQTITSCLGVTHVKGWKSIAFPAISTGIFMIPKDTCANAFKNAIRSFWTRYPDSSVKLIYLCLTVDDYPEFEKVLQKIRPL